MKPQVLRYPLSRRGLPGRQRLAGSLKHFESARDTLSIRWRKAGRYRIPMRRQFLMRLALQRIKDARIEQARARPTPPRYPIPLILSTPSRTPTLHVS